MYDRLLNLLTKASNTSQVDPDEVEDEEGEGKKGDKKSSLTGKFAKNFIAGMVGKKSLVSTGVRKTMGIAGNVKGTPGRKVF